jgi:cytochrome P450
MKNVSPVVIDMTGTDIHAEGEAIRAHGPVAEVELPMGVRAWSITGYREGKQALGDHRFSKNAHLHWPAYINGEIDPAFPLIVWAHMEAMNTAYGEAHDRLRRLVGKAFTPRRVEALRPRIANTVAAILDGLVKTAPGEVVDLKAQFSYPMVNEVMCDLIGVPEHARGTILRGGMAQVNTSLSEEEIGAAVGAVFGEMGALVQAKRAEPGDDMASGLLAAQEADGSGLTEQEVVGMLLLLLGTGTETVVNLVISAVFALLTLPDQYELVKTGKVSWRDVIEETLRAEAPVATMPFRFGVEDIEVDGVTIPAGQPVLVNFAAMGRDPAVHGATAGRFDAARANKDHLAFGYGVYHCIGQALALLEAEVALPALFARFPGMTLAVPAEQVGPQRTAIMNGRSGLPVYLHGARR